MLVTITWDPTTDKWAAHVGYRWTRYWQGSESLPVSIRVGLTLREDQQTWHSMSGPDGTKRVFEIDLTPVEATELIGERIDGEQ